MRKKAKSSTSNTLRIIGGDWRSRRLLFPDAQGLRPTPDRIRETLFNWLQGKVYGTRCLDLFAGSGALGLEALSRGASDVTFVEKNPSVAAQLKSNLELLKSTAEVIQSDALAFMSESRSIHSFDIIFLDPPYRKGLLETSLKAIQEQNLLKANGLLYLEHESEQHFNWQDYEYKIQKQSSAGQVNCFLLEPIVTK